FLIAFGIAIVVYVISYSWIEHRRTHKGPWQVTFTTNSVGAPLLIVNQSNLGLTNVPIVLPPTTSSTTNVPGTKASPLPVSLTFQAPKPVPYPVPFGQCIFMDTTFLPGTLTFNLGGHEIELLPRTVILDHEEHSWKSLAPPEERKGDRAN
ncbi:MAG TPA: hypothetical protein VLT36_13425, partial [Candidatus Dormibacteraeota bacterium]|nr:hypothetical protein [Candidatus Dormibacteraeota bacterium]